MKKIFLVICCLVGMLNLSAQSTLVGYPAPEVYVETTLNADQVRQMALNFSVDKVLPMADGTYRVRICVGKREYADFMALNIPFSILQAPKAFVSMANNYLELVSSWNKYPTYSTYVATMDSFQRQFPNLCKIDTLLAQTPDNHMILAAHISNNLNERGDKPGFWYSSTMHGDEPVGYYMMLHLIHYLLNNYANDESVRELVDNIDIWITPLENPDGTYSSSDNTLNNSPWSTRYNGNGIDLNRSYPFAGASYSSSTDGCEPEIVAMAAFAEAHHFTMSANFHGGAELFNYPWDTWTSNQRNNADHYWWINVGRRFSDTCESYHSGYMTEENGVIEGGDWYVITGSRQDYFNYYHNLREATVEISSDKVVSSSRLPNYWNYIKASLLNYMRESLHGFRGVVTDSLSGEPLQALVFINNFDEEISAVRTLLPVGNYHRPVQSGSYNVTYSAAGYKSKTIEIDVNEMQALRQDVELVPIGYGVEDVEPMQIVVMPNPTSDRCMVRSELAPITEVRIFDVQGRLMSVEQGGGEQVMLNLSAYANGTYFLRISTANGVLTREVVVRK